MSLELKLAIQGRLADFMKEEYEGGRRAVTEGVRETVKSATALARGQVLNGGLGQRLANTWRGRAFPDRGGAVSLNAAGLIYSNAPVVIDAFNRGVQIASSKGFYLAIPTKFAPKNVTFNDGVSGQLRRNKRVTPGGLERALGIKLRFVYNPNGTSFLVADNLRVTKKGTAKRASDRAIAKKQGKSLPLFWLVKSVRMPKKLEISEIQQHVDSVLEGNILRAWQEHVPNA